MRSVESPMASSIPLIEHVDQVEERSGEGKYRLPGLTPRAVAHSRSGWLDERLVKWRWIEKAQTENNYACFECGVVDIRPALETELARRTGLDIAHLRTELLVDQYLLQVFNAMASDGLSFHDAFESVLSSVSHGIAA